MCKKDLIITYSNTVFIFAEKHNYLYFLFSKYFILFYAVHILRIVRRQASPAKAKRKQEIFI